MTPQIFVSYARSDQEQVFPIVEKLREKGLQLWIDHEGIHGAKLWSQEIVHAIEGCKVFILFASSTAFQSQNVTKELALASESGKHILPVFIEDAQVPTAMKYQLAGIQHLIHQKGQTQQTIDNILRTLSNLDIDLAEAPSPAPAISHAPQRTKPNSKAPLAIAAAVILFAVLAFFFVKGVSPQGPVIPAGTAKVYKSTTDLCVVTVHGSDPGEVVSGENRELRDELNSKLSRFKDYKVILAKAVSPDATTQELLDMAKGMNADFILHATTDSEKKRINAKVMNAADGRTFWSKTVRENDVEGEGDFIDEASGLIAAHIAGHDGAIHRDILKKALVKKEEDLTAMELLQLGKAVWEEQTEDVTVKGTEYLERCIELNPDISTAHAILSEVYLEDLRGDYKLIPDAMTKAKASISRAIELNPSNAIALIEQIWISWYEKDFIACKLQAEAALKANPYEPLVLVSVGIFYLSTGIDLELGKKYNDLALRYNETPQGWYYIGYVNYYLTNKEYDKALESTLKAGGNSSGQHATAAALYWLNGEKGIAQKHYKQLIVMEPDFTLEKLKKNQEVWSRAKVSRDLIQKAFKEVVDASKSKDAVE
jgi:tetratricopeptide (TPR) repeat protein